MKIIIYNSNTKEWSNFLFKIITMNNNIPSYNEAAKMFNIVDSYLCEVRNKGWEWNEAVEYIQEHWNDEEFNVNYKNIDSY